MAAAAVALPKPQPSLALAQPVHHAHSVLSHTAQQLRMPQQPRASLTAAAVAWSDDVMPMQPAVVAGAAVVAAKEPKRGVVTVVAVRRRKVGLVVAFLQPACRGSSWPWPLAEAPG